MGSKESGGGGGGGNDDAGADVDVREARPDEFVDAMRLFEGALLEVDAGAVRGTVEGERRGTVLVAVAAGSPVVGALYCRPSPPDDAPPDVPPDATHVVALAVRPERRGRGIGSALIEAASRRADALTAAFDPSVGPFYDALGFDTVGAAPDADSGSNADERENGRESEGANDPETEAGSRRYGVRRGARGR